jgi:hypothetical protein
LDGTREVAPELTDELVRRGYLTGVSGLYDLTPAGRRFLGKDAPPDEDITAVVLASQLLRHVIPIGIEHATPDGGRVVLTSAEIWSHEVVLHWTEICTPQTVPGERVDPFDSMSLTDDVGTSYAFTGGGGRGGLYTQQMLARFLGTPPEDASTLLVTLPGCHGRLDPVHIDLP